MINQTILSMELCILTIQPTFEKRTAESYSFEQIIIPVVPGKISFHE